MTPFRVFASFALAAGLFLAAGSSVAQRGVQPNGGPQPPKLVPIRPGLGQPPPGQHVIIGGELPLVPKSSAAFVSVKVSALVDHPDLKPVLEQLRKTPDALDGFVEAFGLMPHEIDRVTLFWPTLGDRNWFGSPVLVLTTRDAYNEARLLKSLNAEAVFSDNPRPLSARGRRQPAGRRTGLKGQAGQGPGNTDNEDRAAAKAAGRRRVLRGLPRPARPAIRSSTNCVEDRLASYSSSTTIRSSFSPKTLAAARHTSPCSASSFRRRAPGRSRTRLPPAAGIPSLPEFTFRRSSARSSTRRPRNWPPMRRLFAARTGVVTGDLAKSAKLRLTLSFDDAAAAAAPGRCWKRGSRRSRPRRSKQLWR